MAKKSWSVEVNGTQHSIQVEHGISVANATIKVNGQPVTTQKKRAGLGNIFEYSFSIEARPCQVRLKPGWMWGANYQLSVDGRKIENS